MQNSINIIKNIFIGYPANTLLYYINNFLVEIWCLANLFKIKV